VSSIQQRSHPSVQNIVSQQRSERDSCAHFDWRFRVRTVERQRSDSIGFMTKDMVRLLLLLNLAWIVQSFVVSRLASQQQAQSTPPTNIKGEEVGHLFPSHRRTARTRPSVVSVRRDQQQAGTSTTALFSSTLLKRVQKSLTSQERTHEELKVGIAGFYDRSSKLWEDVWGEHMHHVSSCRLFFCAVVSLTRIMSFVVVAFFRATTCQRIGPTTNRRKWI
jgi:hypothetical protein